jgi:hypothetical protein
LNGRVREPRAHSKMSCEMNTDGHRELTKGTVLQRDRQQRRQKGVFYTQEERGKETPRATNHGVKLLWL